MSKSQPLSSNSPILVTGAHRSGTTWVGKMLAASGDLAYISEPLNVWHRPGVLRAPVKHWYTYICHENEAVYLSAFREMLRYHYHLQAEISSLRSVKDALRMLRDLHIFWNGKLSRKSPLLKDPFAVFSAPWFAERLGCQVVFVVRHPAAFASSLKRLNWSFDFRNLLEQPLLIRDLLGPYQASIEELAKCPEDIISQASWLWKMIYQVVFQHQRQFPHFIVVRHEDLSLHPLEGFSTLYAQLGLRFTPRAQQIIRDSSSSENPSELPARRKYKVQMDSAASLGNWKRRLEQREIVRIRQLTEDVAEQFYPSQTWD